MNRAAEERVSGWLEEMLPGLAGECRNHWDQLDWCAVHSSDWNEREACVRYRELEAFAARVLTAWQEAGVRG